MAAASLPCPARATGCGDQDSQERLRGVGFRVEGLVLGFRVYRVIGL